VYASAAAKFPAKAANNGIEAALARCASAQSPREIAMNPVVNPHAAQDSPRARAGHSGNIPCKLEALATNGAAVTSPHTNATISQTARNAARRSLFND